MDLLIVIAAFFVAAAAPMMSGAGAGDSASADAELLKDWTDEGPDASAAAQVAEASDPDDEIPSEHS